MKVHNMPQRSAEWHAIRKGKMTGSHAQAIATQGKGLDTYVYQLVAEKYSCAQKENYTNEHMERGIELESEARSLYELETGSTIEEVGFVEYEEYSGVSPDGLLNDDAIIEIKCHSDVEHLKLILNGSDGIDTGYFWQIQMQLLVTEREYAVYVSYNPNFKNSLLTFTIEKDDGYFEKLRAGLAKGREMIQVMEEKLKIIVAK